MFPCFFFLPMYRFILSEILSPQLDENKIVGYFSSVLEPHGKWLGFHKKGLSLNLSDGLSWKQFAGGIVNNTLRPPVPSFCDPEWRKLMEECWAPDSLVRPSFTEIAGRLRSMSVANQTRAQAGGAGHAHRWIWCNQWFLVNVVSCNSRFIWCYVCIIDACSHM